MHVNDFLAANPLAISVAEARRLAFPNSWPWPWPSPRNELKPNSHAPFSAKLSKATNFGPANDNKSSRGHRFYNELEFKDKGEKDFGLETNRVDEDSSPNLQIGSVPVDGLSLRDDATTASGLLEDSSVGLNAGLDGDLREEDVVRIQGDADLEKDDQFEKFSGKVGFTRVKQVMRRSNLLAKQVISIRSALSLGFVSQLWVDTTSWMVLFVEVRPNLLSGDSEKFLLEDIRQVGDVVLVQDESVIENEFKMVGLETLVGYKVVTPSQRNIGKVRGYTFSINSGAVEELELDSFGLSIIPSSLVSTYSLLVEDVLEVVSDAVVVHEAAASRIQRLSKGLLGNQNVGTSVDDFEDYSDSEQSVTSGHVSRRRKRFGRKKPNRRDWENEDDWELPMDYL